MKRSAANSGSGSRRFSRRTKILLSTLIVVVSLVGVAAVVPRIPARTLIIQPQSSGGGQLIVIVYDDTGVLVPGVFVVLHGPSAFTQNRFTDGSGAALFQNLVSGDYTISASKDGYNSASFTTTVTTGGY